jgi:hypothetical protein
MKAYPYLSLNALQAYARGRSSGLVQLREGRFPEGRLRKVIVDDYVDF